MEQLFLWPDDINWANLCALKDVAICLVMNLLRRCMTSSMQCYGETDSAWWQTSGIQSHKTCFKQQNKTEHWLLLVLKQYECDGETDSSAAVNPEAEHTWNPKHQNVKFTFSSQFIYQLAHKNVLQRSHVAGLFFSPQDKKISVSVWGNEFRETFGSLMKSRQRRLITGNTPTDTL